MFEKIKKGYAKAKSAYRDIERLKREVKIAKAKKQLDNLKLKEKENQPFDFVGDPFGGFNEIGGFPDEKTKKANKEFGW